MILSQIVIEKFKSLIGAMEPWKSLKGSQFVQHLAIMLGWSIEDASYKVERAHQEGFLDTVLPYWRMVKIANIYRENQLPGVVRLIS